MPKSFCFCQNSFQVLFLFSWVRGGANPDPNVPVKLTLSPVITVHVCMAFICGSQVKGEEPLHVGARLSSAPTGFDNWVNWPPLMTTAS